MRNGLPGIDVSFWQGDINWPVVYAAGFRFASIKATEATRGVDPKFARNWKLSREAGFVLMPYHFCRPDMDTGDAEEEADHHFKVIESVGGLRNEDGPPCVDLELLTKGMTGRQGIDWANRHIERLERNFGRRVFVYTYPYFWPGFGVVPYGLLAERPLWVAHYISGLPTVPRPWKTWAFHQYSGDKGEPVPGVQGACDRNVFNGDMLAFLELIEWSHIRPVIVEPMPEVRIPEVRIDETLPAPSLAEEPQAEQPETPPVEEILYTPANQNQTQAEAIEACIEEYTTVELMTMDLLRDEAPYECAQKRMFSLVE